MTGEEPWGSSSLHLNGCCLQSQTRVWVWVCIHVLFETELHSSCSKTWTNASSTARWKTYAETCTAALNHRVSLLHLSPSLPESSSNTCTACLWYCSWDSTRDDSWLTCSIYTHRVHLWVSPLLFIMNWFLLWNNSTFHQLLVSNVQNYRRTPQIGGHQRNNKEIWNWQTSSQVAYSSPSTSLHY